MTSAAESGDDQKKAQVQDYFARTAESYVSSFEHRTGDDLQRLIEIGEWEPQQAALDIATGGGHTALAIAPHVGRITVSDLTPRMLEKAREFLQAQGVTNDEYVVADAEQLPFANATFDRVTCRLAAHHYLDIQQATREVARVLKREGLYLLSDLMAPSDTELDDFINRIEKWRDPSHGRSHRPEELREYFTQAGLLVEQVDFFRSVHNYEAWTERARLPVPERAALEQFFLESDETIQNYFEITRRSDGHLESYTNDLILIKGRNI
jgi:ubiquinone/menaquinone biosynthesis C-methylase UbiE